MSDARLVETDCNGCGRIVFAVPSFVDRALCEKCGRDAAGAHTYQLPPPASWFGAGAARPRTAAAAVRPVSTAAADLGYPVACPKRPPCSWRSRAPDYVTAQIMARVHFHVRHDPAGWVSGVAGGARR